MLTAIIILSSLVFIAFFSGIEIAFITANRLPFELRRKKGSKKGHILASFYDEPHEFLATTLVGINIAFVIYGLFMDQWLGTVWDELGFAKNSVAELMVVTTVSTLIVLCLGEFLPKALFRINPVKTLILFTWPVVFFRSLLKPIVWIMVNLSGLMLRRFIKPEDKPQQKAFTKFDLEQLINNSKPDTENEIDRELFQNALYLNTVKVRDCMIPRLEIEAIEVNDTIEELRQRFIDTQVSRLVIYEHSLDEILGYVHHRKILSRPATIRELIMDIPLVPATMPVRDLLNQFIRTRSNMAWVVDEYGGTAGIVTMEDILEEIFGEIDDEYDGAEYTEQIVSENEFIFSGRLEIPYLNEKYGLDFPEEDYQTLSGFITSIEESIPEQGAEIVYNNFEFEILEVSDTKVDLVKVYRIVDK